MKIMFCWPVDFRTPAEVAGRLLRSEPVEWRNYQKTVEAPYPPRIGERVLIAGKTIVLIPRVEDVEWCSMLGSKEHWSSTRDVVIFLKMNRMLTSSEMEAIVEAGFEPIADFTLMSS